jgi:hypothetical protein
VAFLFPKLVPAVSCVMNGDISIRHASSKNDARIKGLTINSLTKNLDLVSLIFIKAVVSTK